MSTPLLIRPNTSDPKVFGAVYLREVYDAPCPVPVDLVLDLGAYTGLSTRWFCDRYPDATVIGVEPVPSSGTMAQRNAPNAEIISMAIGGSPGSVAVSASSRGEWAAHTRDADDILAWTTVTTVDAILDGRTAQIIKMDIEGAEREVFQNECRWLRDVSLLFLETHDRFLPGCKQAALDAIEATGRNYTWRTRNGSSCDHVVTFKP